MNMLKQRNISEYTEKILKIPHFFVTWHSAGQINHVRAEARARAGGRSWARRREREAHTRPEQVMSRAGRGGRGQTRQ